MTGYEIPALTCDFPGLSLALLIGIVGLILTFGGYRLYLKSLGVLGFVLFFGFEAGVGAEWIARGSGTRNAAADVADSIRAGDVHPKEAIVILCCFAYAIIGALLCVRKRDELQRWIGLLCGALLGVVLVFFVVSAIKPDVDAHLDSSYAGWDSFATITLSVPAALIFAYLLKDVLRYAIIIVTAVVGAILTVFAVVTALECSSSDIIPAGQKEHIQAGAAIILAAIGLVVQSSSSPEAKTRDAELENDVENNGDDEDSSPATSDEEEDDEESS